MSSSAQLWPSPWKFWCWQMSHDQTIHLTKFQKNSSRGCWDIRKVKLPNEGQDLHNYDLDPEIFDVDRCPMTKQYIWKSFRKIQAGAAEI